VDDQLCDDQQRQGNQKTSVRFDIPQKGHWRAPAERLSFQN
jgi:hypothetical protein